MAKIQVDFGLDLERFFIGIDVRNWETDEDVELRILEIGFFVFILRFIQTI